MKPPTLNLLADRWIPVVRFDGSRERIAPWQITDTTPENPAVALDAPRADFNGSLVQLLIGLVQTTCPPRNDREWARYLQQPPDPEYLQRAFAPLVPVFGLTAGPVRFMQVANLAGGVEWPIEKLLLEMPGTQTIDQNRDFFQKRGTVTGLCPACTAMALYTLQCTGPAGGGGHLTGIRGGGPVTTIVTGSSLWETVWLNVLNEDEFAALGAADKTDLPDRFPWVPPVRGREHYPTTAPDDVHPANLYWGMPRRILLDDQADPGVCSVCGEETPTRITRFFMKKWGINYAGAWRHPLTPYYRKNEDLLPEHANPGGIRYKHWIGLVQADPEGNQEAPRAVDAFFRRWPLLPDGVLPPHPMLWAFGFDMDKAKARAWYEGELPLTYVPEGDGEAVQAGIAQIVKTADLIRYSTVTAIRNALTGPNGALIPEIPGVSNRFWQETEPLFYSAVADLIAAGKDEEGTVAAKRTWLLAMTRYAESLFGYYAQMNHIGAVNYPQQIAKARRDLRIYTAPGNKKIRERLGLPEEMKNDGKP